MIPTYTPTHFSLDNPLLIRHFLQQHYFGLLFTQDLQLSAVPLWFDWDSATALTGTLYCHLARQNPHRCRRETRCFGGNGQSRSCRNRTRTGDLGGAA